MLMLQGVDSIVWILIFCVCVFGDSRSFSVTSTTMKLSYILVTFFTTSPYFMCSMTTSSSTSSFPSLMSSMSSKSKKPRKVRQKKKKKIGGGSCPPGKCLVFGGGKCPNLGVVNVRILGVVNVRLANNLTPFCLTHMFFPGSGTKCPLGQNVS